MEFLQRARPARHFLPSQSQRRHVARLLPRQLRQKVSLPLEATPSTLPHRPVVGLAAPGSTQPRPHRLRVAAAAYRRRLARRRRASLRCTD